MRWWEFILHVDRKVAVQNDGFNRELLYSWHGPKMSREPGSVGKASLEHSGNEVISFDHHVMNSG